jgi:hypothetical protein
MEIPRGSSVFAPRAAFLALWLFTHRVGRAFDRFNQPLLGLLLLPYTTLLYVIAYVPPEGVRGWRRILLLLGIVLDVATHVSSGYGPGGGRLEHVLERPVDTSPVAPRLV